jgi:SCP1.201-like deaminase
MAAKLRQRLRPQEGQASLDYLGVIAAAALVVLALIFAAPGLGGTIACGLEQAAGEVTGAGAGSCGADGAGPATTPPPPGDPPAASFAAAGDPAPPSSPPPSDELPEDSLPPDPIQGDTIYGVPRELYIHLPPDDQLAIREAWEAENAPAPPEDYPEPPPGSVEVIDPEELGPPGEEDWLRPWERVGMSEEEWAELERAVIDEACPGGWQEALVGCPIIGLTWDEDGELAPIELQEMGIGSGLLKLLTRAKPVLSVPRALGQAIPRIPLALKNKLVAAGVLRSPGARLPAYTGGKTQGVLDLGTRELQLISGRTGYAQGIPRGTSGFNAYFRTHVEGHAVAYMRRHGIREATVYINQAAPCAGTCMRMIPRALPEGYVLRVVGSEGRTFIFRGVAPG